MSWLVLYLLFLIVALLVSGYLITKLDIKRPALVIFFIAFIISSPVIASYFYSTYVAPVPEVNVPNIAWLDISEAKVKLAKFGLKIRVSEKAYEKNVPEGKIISQRPEAGSIVKVGRIVNIKVSIGEREVIVPNLVGRSLSQIKIVLSEVGLKMGEKEYKHSEQYQSGVVIAQNPFPDEEVPAGSEINVLIAENPNFGTVRVPDLVSVSMEEAKEILRTLKLNSIVFYHETKQFKEGVVLSQDPIKGEELKMGSVVKIYVSKLPQPKEKIIETE